MYIKFIITYIKILLVHLVGSTIQLEHGAFGKHDFVST